MENVESKEKKIMTDEERLELAAKLDKELDEFINNLPKKRYEDGWPEDRWEEEMDKHPFFMKKLPEPGSELHPLYEGLQQLKYDPDENEPDDLAISYKDDGNFNFKHKNYRLAILSYTEGIKIKCGNSDIESTLLNNRAAAHYFLKNFRSALRDCELALKINPNYDKAIVRAANCCCEMKQYDKAVEYCDEILHKEKDRKDMLDLRKKCINAAKIQRRDERKRDVAAKKKAAEEDMIVREILSRGIRIAEGSKGGITLEKLEPCFPELVHNRVHLDESNSLIWPVVFLYPEYKIMDYIQEFNENHTFLDQFSSVFESHPEFDVEKKYTAKNLNVYFETENKKIIHVDVNKSLGTVLKINDYIIKGGTPSFILLVRNSPAENRFLDEY